MKVLRVSAVLILITGACFTARAVYLHAKARLAGVLIRRAWEQSLQSGKVHAPWSWADTYPIARLRIPHLGYDEIVLEGATPRRWHSVRRACSAEPGWEKQETLYLRVIAQVGSNRLKRSRRATQLISNGLINDQAGYVNETTP